jgi:hypothetical protein
MFKTITVTILSILLTGCIGGGVNYTPPAALDKPIASTKTVNRPIDSVWKDSVAELGKNFFVINNIDKSSGLINVSYSGDPEKYVDCGFINSSVTNARGKRDYDFNAAKASMTYESTNGTNLFQTQRTMTLEGRVNLIFQATTPRETTVTANTRYSMTRTNVTQMLGNPFPQTKTESVAFNAGQPGTFPGSGTSTVTCRANGDLERTILDSIK